MTDNNLAVSSSAQGLGEAIEFQLTGDFDRAIEIYRRLGLESYEQLARSHQFIEKELVDSVTKGLLDVSPDTYDYITQNAIKKISDPIAVFLFIISAGIYVDYPGIDGFLDRAYAKIESYDKRLQPLLYSWYHYTKTLASLREYAAIEEHRYYVHRKYIFGVDGDTSQKLSPISDKLRKFADQSLQQAEGFSSGRECALGRSVRQLRLALENLKANFSPAWQRFQALETCSLRELHGIASGVFQSDPTGDNMRALCRQIQDRLGDSLIVEVFKYSGQDHPEHRQFPNVLLHPGGTLPIRSWVVRSGAIIIRDDQRTYSDVKLYALYDALLLDPRGQVARGEYLLTSSASLPDADYHKRCSEFQGIWAHLRIIKYSTIFQNKNAALAIRGPARSHLDIGSDVVLIPDIFPSKMNYAHWMLDVLPRVISATRHLGKSAKITFLWELTEVQLGSLLALGIEEKQVFKISIPLGTDSFPIRIGSAQLPLPYFSATRVNGDLLIAHPEPLKAIRALFLAGMNGAEPAGERKYISRTNRKPNNEAEYISILEKYGVFRADHSNLGFEEQRAFFYNTDLLVTPGGAGLANMIFMRPGSTIISIYEEHFNCSMFSYLAGIFGIRYITLVGKLSGDFSRRAGEQEFIVDAHDLDIALKLALDKDGSIPIA